MLDKELDKLRDKTLSFGCVIFEKSWGDVNYHRITTVKKQDNGEHTCECGGYEIFDISEYNIIGHPLTRGRIQQLEMDICMSEYKDYNDSVEGTEVMLDFGLSGETTPIVKKIEHILLYKGLGDKTEIERMKSPHREELKELLIQFSNYL